MRRVPEQAWLGSIPTAANERLRNRKQEDVTQYPSNPWVPQMRTAAPPSMTLSDSVYERLLQQRIIVLGQQVDSEISNRIAAQMLLLAAEDAEADISLYINSPGGSVPDGMAIFDTM